MPGRSRSPLTLSPWEDGGDYTSIAIDVDLPPRSYLALEIALQNSTHS